MSTPEGWRRSRRETWRAPAKINLWLSITGRLPDGYHTVDTCYQAIDLSDRVVMEPSGGGAPLGCEVAGEMAEGVDVLLPLRVHHGESLARDLAGLFLGIAAAGKSPDLHAVEGAVGGVKGNNRYLRRFGEAFA